MATSTSVGGKQRIDWAVTAGQTYYFRVKSSGSSIDLTIANLVARVGSQTTVFGTAGADQFEFDAAPSLRVSIGGLAYQLPPATAATVTFGGGVGDTVVLRGASGDDTVTLRPGTATFSGAGFVVNVANTADITVYGQGGHDTASLYDSAEDDNFLGTPTYAAMYGDGFYNRAWNFSSVRAEAGDGIDVAKFYDSPGTTSTSAHRPTTHCPARPITTRPGTSRGATPTRPPAASTRPGSTTRPATTNTSPPRPTPRCSTRRIATPT